MTWSCIYCSYSCILTTTRIDRTPLHRKHQRVCRRAFKHPIDIDEGCRATAYTDQMMPLPIIQACCPIRCNKGIIVTASNGDTRPKSYSCPVIYDN